MSERCNELTATHVLERLLDYGLYVIGNLLIMFAAVAIILGASCLVVHFRDFLRSRG